MSLLEGGEDLRNVPKKCQANVDQEIGTAASDGIDTDRRNCEAELVSNSTAHDDGKLGCLTQDGDKDEEDSSDGAHND